MNRPRPSARLLVATAVLSGSIPWGRGSAVAQSPAADRAVVQPETAAGLGFEVTRRNGHTMVGHQGGDLGVASWVYHFPETGYTMVGMTNRDPRAARVLLQGFRGLVTRSTLGGAAVPPQDCVPPS